MRPEQWETFKRAANQQAGAALPLALIVDSPWIPGYLGIGYLDYFFDGDTWFEANLKIAREFADVILFPSWWVEYGMAIETSALGNRIHFRTDQPPAQSPALFRLDDVEHLAAANPEADGLMPLALHRYRTYKQRIFDAGYTIPAVATRGPLCLAAFLRGVTEFMIDITEQPEAAHKLLALTTETAIRWLQAQAQAIGTSVECILVLDDIVGFLSRKLYLEFAHPYLKRICEAFPREWVKVYHNDANVRPFLSDLPETGFQVLNWSHRVDVREAREKTGGKMCLMGNVAPLDVGVRGTPEEVEAAALEVLGKTNGEGMILSVGGGVSPGMPKANILALIQAAHSFCAASAARTPSAPSA